MNNKTIGNIFKGDKVIWMIFFFLCMISIIEVYSASSSLTYKTGNYMAPVIRHIGLLGLGLLTMICMLKVKCKFFKIVTPFMLGLSFILLLWVLVAGQSTNGASRWISLAGINFQPSEIAKGAVVLAVAQILSAMQTEHGAEKRAFKYILIVSGIFVALIGLENLSTAMLLCFTILCMMIIGRVPMRQIGKLVGTALIAICIIFASIMIVGKDKGDTAKPENSLTEKVVQDEKEETGVVDKLFHRADTWKARIDKWTSSKTIAPEDVDLDKDAQVAHANIAIASSNIAGNGPGNSVERDFLSQAYSDFIYAIIIEEMGIEGAIFVALLYIFLLFRAGRIANRCENNFPAFLCMGLAILLVIQALFNMLVAVGLAPVTGQPLPLISRGGTSTVINCLYLGIILSISRTAKKKEGAQNMPNSDKIAVA
ncbi:FtsW/RodA/SpoVE family cell cycle protein [Segatella copri]|jgi:cell division protein FtsW|uniref:FtsW/RodA/SpoVE family cell cycle protein n=1 Tax=Segatella copri TaxID=165179 RepID=UPI001C47F56A|nr:FtsW/RodA/SpoVE family cell cycle protein [Segatella copri]MBW0049433.1 FtsW/RodA/SpoVE family cell cycle protein [Segatella copri]MCW4118996.1 FtsW/RodA/SpoVE family cell cycle protein [Segatella copri]